MKPAPFDYRAPQDLDEALTLLTQYGDDSKWLAGGQSLIPMLNFRLASPTLLIDGNGLSELDHVTPTSQSTLRIGAMTRQARLERDSRIHRLAPLLSEAVPLIAHPQIRHRGTVGGSLAHADPAAELPVVMVALEARFRLLSASGERWVQAPDFFIGLLETALEPDEILAEVEIPRPPERCGQVFLEVARRHGDYAQVGIAAHLELDVSGRCSAARLVYLSVGDTPMRAENAAALLVGQQLDDELCDAVADLACSEEIDPAGDIHASTDFKRHLAEVLTRRALKAAWQRASDPGGSLD